MFNSPLRERVPETNWGFQEEAENLNLHRGDPRKGVQVFIKCQISGIFCQKKAFFVMHSNLLKPTCSRSFCESQVKTFI